MELAVKQNEQFVDTEHEKLKLKKSFEEDLRENCKCFCLNEAVRKTNAQRR